MIIALSMISIPVSAHAADNLWNVSGWIRRGDTSALMNGIIVKNTSNTTETATSNATGQYVLSVTSDANQYVLYVTPTAGYIQNTSVKYAADGADNATINVTMILVTPSISGITEAAAAINSQTISWTATATDGVDNSYVGSRILYSEDSGLAANTFYSGWSNDTATPSITLTNLKVYTKYYYQVETKNHLNGAYYATSTGDFTTKSGVSSTYGKTPVATTTQKSLIPRFGGVSGSNNGLIVLAVIGIVAYFVLFGTGKGGSKKGRKK